MRLLDWMHRKFRNGEPLRDFATGNPCTCLIIGQPSLDDLEYYPKSNYYAKPSSKARETQLLKSFSCIRADDEHMGEESSAALSELLFHGFLAIGTLGTDPHTTSDPATPTFSTSVEYIMEKETEATENELQFINDELEKVLGAEGKEDEYSSGRNSYVSIGRSSHGSTITLSGKPLEAAENEINGAVACPLQGYLFGSTIGLPETTTLKKEHRTSLGELFQKTKIAEENSGGKCNRVEEKQKEKDTDKSAVHLMKKILKGRKASGGTIDNTSADKKVHKILHLFHKKVHPETTTKSQNQSKYLRNKTCVNEEGHKRRNQMLSGEDITIFPFPEISKKGGNNAISNMPEGPCGASDSNGNRECWIKSDADYLVLEL